jgi:methylglyoxal synthase
MFYLTIYLNNEDEANKTVHTIFFPLHSVPNKKTCAQTTKLRSVFCLPSELNSATAETHINNNKQIIILVMI